jgi:cholesterol transport system auxiliary component
MGALGGCAGMLTRPLPTYDLTAPRAFPRHVGPPRGQLIVVEPTALSILDSERIVVRPSPVEVGYLQDAQWSDRLPRLMQERIIQAFENASRLRAVGRPRDRMSADYQLVTDVRAFDVSFFPATVAEAEISAKVVSERGGRILAARVFRASVPAASPAGPAGIAALDQAFQRVATDLVLWTARLF